MKTEVLRLFALSRAVLRRLPLVEHLLIDLYSLTHPTVVGSVVVVVIETISTYTTLAAILWHPTGLTKQLST